MLAKCRETVGSDERVRYALCQLPVRKGQKHSQIDFEEAPADVIVCHLSLASLARDTEDLKTFSRWCSEIASNTTGRVVVNVHNRALHNDILTHGFERWEDPFRKRLYDAIHAENLQEFLRGQQSRFSPDEIQQAFRDAGFPNSEEYPEQIDISMSDRGLMWKVPAILDSFVDVKAIGIQTGKRIVDSVLRSVIENDTMPRTVVTYVFRR